MKSFRISLVATLFAASTAYAQPPADAPRGEHGQKGLERLKAADTNGDGKISRDEANASLPHIAKNFDAIDTNKDGFITRDELQAAGEQGRKKMHDHLKAADANGDGKISREEANASLPRLAKHFDEIDANKDGFITREEMRAFHEKNGGRK